MHQGRDQRMNGLKTRGGPVNSPTYHHKDDKKGIYQKLFPQYATVQQCDQNYLRYFDPTYQQNWNLIGQYSAQEQEHRMSGYNPTNNASLDTPPPMAPNYYMLNASSAMPGQVVIPSWNPINYDPAFPTVAPPAWPTSTVSTPPPALPGADPSFNQLQAVQQTTLPFELTTEIFKDLKGGIIPFNPPAENVLYHYPSNPKNFETSLVQPKESERRELFSPPPIVLPIQQLTLNEPVVNTKSNVQKMVDSIVASKIPLRPKPGNVLNSSISTPRSREILNDNRVFFAQLGTFLVQIQAYKDIDFKDEFSQKGMRRVRQSLQEIQQMMMQEYKHLGLIQMFEEGQDVDLPSPPTEKEHEDLQLEKIKSLDGTFPMKVLKQFYRKRMNIVTTRWKYLLYRLRVVSANNFSNDDNAMIKQLLKRCKERAK